MDAQRSCYQKHRYGDEKEARKVAGKAFDRRRVKLRAYPCYECGGWHLTKKITTKKKGPRT